MSFLFVATRELRVAARRKSTRYVRGAATLLGLVIGGFYMLLFGLSGSGRSGLGGYMFTVLSWYALLTTLLAGVFLASDCLSEERREGTLGLLFLTDLKGYEIVLGKFLAVSLNAFYGLLSYFPVLALCLLTGGVSGNEFWRTCLALLNFLFFSVTAGMLVSSFCQSAYQAMLGTIGLLVIWLVAGGIALAADWYDVGAVSPFAAFHWASDANYFRLAREYWESLALSNLMGWIFLGWAGWRLRTFVDKSQVKRTWPKIFTRDLIGSTTGRRRKLMEINPVLWLLDDSRRLRWVVSLLVLLALAMLFFAVSSGPSALLTMPYAMWPFYFILKAIFAAQACRFFAESRRTGALELLCCTPLTMRAAIKGQWMLLRRVFLWPVILLLAAHLAALIYGISSSAGGISTIGGGQSPFAFFFYYYYFKAIPNTIADFFAIGWFGMWLALSLPRPNLAAGVTILSVVILPICIPALVTDAIFIAIGCVKLSEDFRLRQAQWVTRKLKTA